MVGRNWFIHFGIEVKVKSRVVPVLTLDEKKSKFVRHMRRMIWSDLRILPVFRLLEMGMWPSYLWVC